jgi:hypothetical protein
MLTAAYKHPVWGMGVIHIQWCSECAAPRTCEDLWVASF